MWQWMPPLKINMMHYFTQKFVQKHVYISSLSKEIVKSDKVVSWYLRILIKSFFDFQPWYDGHSEIYEEVVFSNIFQRVPCGKKCLWTRWSYYSFFLFLKVFIYLKILLLSLELLLEHKYSGGVQKSNFVTFWTV